jgi:hypothetical protein
MLDSLYAGLAEATPNFYDAVLAPLGGFLSRPMRIIRLPDEPTTLLLALVCLGTVGAYIAVTRYVRPNRTVDRPTTSGTIVPPQAPKRKVA